MANFKITETSLFHYVQTHEFKKQNREHIDFTKKQFVDGAFEFNLKHEADKIGVNEEDILNIVNQSKKPKDIVGGLLWSVYNGYRQKDLIIDRFNLWLEKDIRKIVITDKCTDLISSLKVDKNIRYDFLKTLPNRLDLIYLKNNMCLIYKKTDTKVTITYIFHDKNKLDTEHVIINQNTIDVDLVNNKHYYSNYDEEYFDETRVSMYTLFVQIVSFIELGDINIKIVPAKDKVGNFIKGDECRNLTKKEFILVDTDWNNVSVRLDGFPVKGHLRLQPCGSGRKEYKLIYIQPFLKNGYNRNHLKDTDANLVNVEFEEIIEN